MGRPKGSKNGVQKKPRIATNVHVRERARAALMAAMGPIISCTLNAKDTNAAISVIARAMENAILQDRRSLAAIIQTAIALPLPKTR
jgi:hypothetical protein